VFAVERALDGASGDRAPAARARPAVEISDNMRWKRYV